MSLYTVPEAPARPSAPPKTAYLIASGDLRESANIAGWPTQEKLERDVTGVIESLGWNVRRANPVDPVTGHGFISSQRMGLEVFKGIPVDAPLIVAEAVWQYSHHVLAGLRDHRGPILTVANFVGDWPGLVGLLGLNAGLTKMGRDYSTIWSVDFTDPWFRAGLKEWTEAGHITHDASHVRSLPELPDSPEKQLGEALAAQLLADTDIKARTKFDGSFETGPLSDEPDTATYSSQHFKALGRPETWDVAVRVWRLEPGKAQERYEELLTSLPGSSEKDGVATRSFIASENEIRGVGFLDTPRGIVVLLTCGTNQCLSQDDVSALAQVVYARLRALLPATLGGGK